MKSSLPSAAVVAVAVVAVLMCTGLAGCSSTSDAAADSAPRATVTESPAATTTPEPPVAAVVPAAPAAPAPVTAPAPAYVDYLTPVTKRWGGCFSRLGIGDVYFDDTSSTVVGGSNLGTMTWNVGPGNAAGTPADQATTDALAGC